MPLPDDILASEPTRHLAFSPLNSFNTPRRILFITAWLPERGHWTATAGIARRQAILLDGLRATGLVVDVLVIVSERQMARAHAAGSDVASEGNAIWAVTGRVTACQWQASEHESIWGSYLAPAIDYRKMATFRRFLHPNVLTAIEAAIVPATQLVFCQSLACAVAFLHSQKRDVSMAFDMDDVEHVSFRRRIAEPPIWRAKFLRYFQIPALKYAEQTAIRRSIATFVCSNLDREILVRLAAKSTVHTLPNAVAARDIGPPAPAETLLILGHYSFTPNRVGADYFIEQVWPLVRMRVPRAKLIVAGADPHLLANFASSPAGVMFSGYVDDLLALYRDTRVAVCPILSGGGTRLKVMEAAAYGRPIVSTTIGAEGIDFIDTKEILIADGATEMANACISLLEDHSKAIEMGLQARHTVEDRYSRERIISDLGRTLASHAVPASSRA